VKREASSKLQTMILANLLTGWQPEPRDKVEYWLWLAEQVMRL